MAMAVHTLLVCRVVSSPLVLNNSPAVGSGLGSTPGEYRSATRLYLLCSRIPTRTMHTNTRVLLVLRKYA